MKRIPILFLMFLPLSVAYSQQITDFEKYKKQQQAAFAEYKQQKQNEFKNYRDSLNKAFASFLEQDWKRFDLQKPEPAIKRPIPKPPVYDIATPKPQFGELPLVKQPVIPVPQFVDPKPVLKPIPIPDQSPTPAPQETANTVLFGTDISLKNISIPAMHLSSTEEKDIAKYWRLLTNTPYLDVINETRRMEAALKLNDWGVYQLLGKIFEIYCPKGNFNEQVVFTVFMLNQMGYHAKIGKSNSELLPLVAFSNKVTNCMYFSYGDNVPINYYVINPQHKVLSSVSTCTIDYADAVNSLDLRITASPLFATATVAKPLTFYGNTYVLKYNKNKVDFYESYPCADFSLYAKATLDEVLLQSIEAQIAPNVVNKSQEEAVNWLLHFVQNAFEYKKDDDQFGYEKFFFAEETIASSYSDCEDRSILFAQLVRHLLRMPVVLIYYPGRHLATAVKFDNSHVLGDYIVVNGEKYLICDPTYINANLGMAMPDLIHVPIEVIVL